MSDDTRSCVTCWYSGTSQSAEPCKTCVSTPDPWKQNWTPVNPTTAQMRAMMDAVANGMGVTVTHVPVENVRAAGMAPELGAGYGTTPEAMATGGVKYDADKPRMDLLDAYAIEQLALVLAFGAKKYDSHNWRKGIAKSRLIAAALRHLFAYLRGEDKDPETGLSHAAHAMCCCMFLLGLEHRTELDDRWKESA